MPKDNYDIDSEPGVPKSEGESWQEVAERLDLGSRARIAALMADDAAEQTGNKAAEPDTES